ncbi:MAG: Holliday junction branch migration protein RuvA [Eubacterium sp.]|nr:Holliday junction branch migration protein RuvA [Eubacterium sp.]
MISYIKGIIEEIELDQVIVDHEGIGYNIFMPQSDLEILGIGEEVKIHTYLSVREDAIQLFGFLSRESLKLYKMLLGVSGVGPKGGLAIISACPGDSLQMAIISGDSKAIAKAQGIGNKTAQKVILELKDKISIEEVIASPGTETFGKNTASSAQTDAIEALTSLGYSQTAAFQAVKSVPNSETMDVEELLKLALKNIAL